MSNYEFLYAPDSHHHQGEGFSEQEMEVADRIARRFRQAGIAEYDDLRQECLIWFVEHPQKAAEYAEQPRQLYVALSNVARHYVARERAAKGGWDPSDQYHYSIGMVEDLLPLIFSVDWVHELTTKDSDAKPPSNPQEGGNLLAMVADIRTGFDRLNDSDKEVLSDIYAFGEPRRNLADRAAYLGITTDAMRKRVRRTLGRLRKPIGGAPTRYDQPEEAA